MAFLIACKCAFQCKGKKQEMVKVLSDIADNGQMRLVTTAKMS
jgi:hypothetical protein